MGFEAARNWALRLSRRRRRSLRGRGGQERGVKAGGLPGGSGHRVALVFKVTSSSSLSRSSS